MTEGDVVDYPPVDDFSNFIQLVDNETKVAEFVQTANG